VESVQPEKSLKARGVEERTGGKNLFCKGTESREDLFFRPFFFH